MSVAILALLALIAIIVISAIRTDLNTGVLAVALAYIVGVYFANLSVSSVSAYRPEQLVLTLVGVTLLFGMAQQNGTLDRLAGFALRAARGHSALLPLIFFLLTFILSAIGPGNIAAVALVAPIGMAVAVNSGVSPLVMAIVICTGANAGAFSPVALTGIVNAGLMSQIGLDDPRVAIRIFIFAAVLQSMSALAAYLIFGVYRIRQSQATALAVKPSQPSVFDTRHLITLLAILALVVSVVVFNVAVVVGAFVLAGLLALFKIGDVEVGLQHLPWGVISLVAGISVLVGLLETTGNLDLATRALASYSSPQTVNATLVFTTGVVSIYSSSSGVVMPTFIPLLPGLIQVLGGGNLTEMVVAVDVGSHLVDVSPLSTLGALCLAALPEAVNKSTLFRRLLLWGVSMSVAEAALAFVFLDLL
jgi:Na+/H+ antiporter NhaD/arsenite permease-like protein